MVRRRRRDSPIWASRVLGEFPTDSSNALFPLAALEAARTAPKDPGGPVVVGIDVAGPGKDRTVAVACADGAIIDTGVWTLPDSTGVVLAFLKRWASRLRHVKVDSTGLGFHFVTILHREGFPAEGLNASSSAQEKDRFSNLKAERYWHLRERPLRGEITGLSDEALGELAAISYVIDARGKTAIEDKAGVKSVLGRSPDIAEAIMLALGEPRYEPYRYSGLARGHLPVSAMTPAFDQRRSRTGGGVWGSCEAQDRMDDCAGDPTSVYDPGAPAPSYDTHERMRYGSLYRRRAW